MSGTRPYSGIWPVAPTPFADDGALDREGMGRVIDCMIDQGVDGICILANFSEQFLLSDAERAELTRLCLERVAGRKPVIVTVSHFATQVVEARACEAAAMGAAMLMMMPPYHGVGLRAEEDAVFEHFARAGAAGGIPIMVQDAPLSGVTLSVPFLVRLAREIEQVRLFKIETPQAAAKLRALIAVGGDAVEGPFDGEEAITLIADLDAGATGTMTSATLPDLIRPAVVAHREGRRAEADGDLCAAPAADQLREPPVRLALVQGGDEGGRRDRLRARAPPDPAAAPRDPRPAARARAGGRPAGAALGALTAIVLARREAASTGVDAVGRTLSAADPRTRHPPAQGQRRDRGRPRSGRPGAVGRCPARGPGGTAQPALAF